MRQIHSQIIMLFCYGNYCAIFIYLLVLFIVIILLFLRYQLFLSNAQSSDTPVHQGSIGDTTREPGTSAAIVPPNYVG
jgi:hypothetical protein